MNNKRGQILPIVLLMLTVLLIMVPALTFWMQQDARSTAKEQRSTVAFNLAEAGIDRGMWKLKSSTTTWDDAAKGIAIAGYNFDTSYTDIAGGAYRIRFSSGSATGTVAITAEGRDSSTNEKRAIRAVYRNQSIPGAVISGGVISWANAFSAYWGPVMSLNNINITDANAAQDYFPRKYSKQVVTCNSKGYARDVNGLDPPNNDADGEWFSDYPVPDLPVLDFTALRASATATGTLNVYGCTKTGASWDIRWPCSGVGGTGSDHSKHFGNTWNHPKALKKYVWYWDNDVEIIGGLGNEGCGIYGTIIVRGNLTLNTGDNYAYTGPVPAEAWRDHIKLTKTTFDTKATNEYPADDGLHKNRSTFKFGSEIWTGGKSPPASAALSDVGVRGFIYCGGDLTVKGPIDINGAVWVAGNVSKAVGVDRCNIFFDDTLDLPTLNVVLVRQSWQETRPTTTPWP